MQTENNTVENGESKDAKFREVAALFCQLQEYKGKRYGSSWCKHGEAISIFGNVSRKFDRMENIVKQSIQGIPLPHPESEESLAETVADLGVYAILWMTWISQNRPDEYEAWKSRILKAVSLL